MLKTDDYIATLKKRGKESKVYKKHQLIGLEIAQILSDEKHKTLYIKLAKEGEPEKLIALAKRIADTKNINNRGAYFMKVVTSEKSKNKQWKK